MPPKVRKDELKEFFNTYITTLNKSKRISPVLTPSSE